MCKKPEPRHRLWVARAAARAIAVGTTPVCRLPACLPRLWGEPAGDHSDRRGPASVTWVVVPFDATLSSPRGRVMETARATGSVRVDSMWDAARVQPVGPMTSRITHVVGPVPAAFVVPAYQGDVNIIGSRSSRARASRIVGLSTLRWCARSRGLRRCGDGALSRAGTASLRPRAKKADARWLATAADIDGVERRV